MNKLPYDELNALESRFLTQKEKGTLTKEKAVDEVLDILIMSYVFGNLAATEMLGVDIPIDESDLQDAIYRRVADKDFTDRVSEYADAGDIYGISLVAETDSHRVYSQAVQNAAERSGKNVRKVWMTMMDDKVRDTHDYLLGMSVGINDRFYTYDGDSALYPGDFALVENNANCRCYIDLITE